jgi:hypothetical protein
MFKRKYQWPYNDKLGTVSVNYEDGVIEEIDLIVSSKKPKKAMYKHTHYNNDGTKIMEFTTDIENNLRPVIKNPSEKEHLAGVTYGYNNNVVSETFMCNVWSGLLKREWIVSKINYYDEQGNFIESENNISSLF